jgi:4-amino-4-deoxy-L-arabinose transferase-like glycosyltransferase
MQIIIPPRSAPFTRAALVLIVLGSCLLTASTWLVFSHTWDEPEHLAAGLELLDRGRYDYDTQHPPIARVLIALGPYLAGARSFGSPPPDGVPEGIHVLYDAGRYRLYLALARLGVLPFLALLLLAAWLWARRIASSDAEALLAVVLLAAVPPILGHAGLATLDVPAAATTLLALYLLQRWLAHGGALNAILLGLSAGVAIGTKLSALPFLGLGALALAVVRAALKIDDSARLPAARLVTTPSINRRLLGVVLSAVMVGVSIIVAYGWHSASVVPLPRRFDWVLPYLFRDVGLGHRAQSWAHGLHLPAALWDLAEGVARLKTHNDAGHFSFLLGQERSSGWWYFYLVALAVKTPLPLLATGPAGLALMARDGWCRRDSWRIAPPALFVTILAFASLYSHINIGVRHVLVLYPFLAIGGAHAFSRTWNWLSSSRYRIGVMLGNASLVALVAWQVSALWRVWPDYLPYFNPWVTHPERVLVDSDLDWGQDLWRLERRLRELEVPRFSFAYIGTADLSREPLPPLQLLPPVRRVSGWVAITALAREHDDTGYAWLDGYPPRERVGKTIDLYYIP